MKTFNTTGVCIPSKHYMVDISGRIREIKKMVDDGKYFTMNRARQYGKTTTLYALAKELVPEYTVLNLDFQEISNDAFQSEDLFSKTMAGAILDLHEFHGLDIPEDVMTALHDLADSAPGHAGMDDLFRLLKRWMKDAAHPIVLIIDEVDSAANNQVFLDFLAQLRAGYLQKEANGVPAFQSVILAGVTDVKHLKSRLRDEEQVKVNSPWNIAADFNIDMSLSSDGIRGMLDEYEADHHTGMETGSIAKLIYDYTSGYPFLVSRLCQLMDADAGKASPVRSAAWTRQGLENAVRILLSEDNTLFQSVTAKLQNYPALEAALKRILMEGEKLTYNAQQDSIAQLQMYGFIKKDANAIRISNRIFETLLYNLFLSEEEMKQNRFMKEASLASNLFVTDGKLNMRLIIERFVEAYHQILGPLTDHFQEKDGRELFLLYLKPIINGTGNFYIEAQTRDLKRTDVIVDYLGEQYIIELKIWHGERYNKEGEKQIADYLDYFNLDTGYMLSFSFNRKKEVGVRRVNVGDKVLFEGTV